jgi:hypothetical protein
MDRGPFGSNHPDVAPLSPKDTTMTDLKIEAGKCYRTRDGRKAHVLGIRDDVDVPHPVIGFIEGDKTTHCWCKDGGYYATSAESGYDLISEWKEPRSGEVWVSVSRRGVLDELVVAAHEYPVSSDMRCLAILGPIPWTEGQGLTGEGSE